MANIGPGAGDALQTSERTVLNANIAARNGLAEVLHVSAENFDSKAAYAFCVFRRGLNQCSKLPNNSAFEIMCGSTDRERVFEFLCRLADEKRSYSRQVKASLDVLLTSPQWRDAWQRSGRHLPAHVDARHDQLAAAYHAPIYRQVPAKPLAASRASGTHPEEIPPSEHTVFQARTALNSGVAQITNVLACDLDSKAARAFGVFRRSLSQVMKLPDHIANELLAEPEQKTRVLEFLLRLLEEKRVYCTQVKAILVVLIKHTMWNEAHQAVCSQLTGKKGEASDLCIEPLAAESSSASSRDACVRPAPVLQTVESFINAEPQKPGAMADLFGVDVVVEGAPKVAARMRKRDIMKSACRRLLRL